MTGPALLRVSRVQLSSPRLFFSSAKREMIDVPLVAVKFCVFEKTAAGPSNISMISRPFMLLMNRIYIKATFSNPLPAKHIGRDNLFSISSLLSEQFSYYFSTKKTLQ